MVSFVIQLCLEISVLLNTSDVILQCGVVRNFGCNKFEFGDFVVESCVWMFSIAMAWLFK